MIKLHKAVEIVRLHRQRRDIDSLVEELMAEARQDVLGALVRTAATINAEELRAKAKVRIKRLEDDLSGLRPEAEALKTKVDAVEGADRLNDDWLELKRQWNAARGKVKVVEGELVDLANTIKALDKLDKPDDTFKGVLRHILVKTDNVDDNAEIKTDGGK